ncbi:MAG TPA: hypothetical protein VLQ80_25360 [Candidatus Saccharimonadia bacterium]|nr:hypothetical protein [Candidatus Saccharimonadia bacterium]
MSLPSFAPIREQIAVSLHHPSPRVLLEFLMIVACVAMDQTRVLPIDDYPRGTIEALSERFAEEMQALRATWASLQEHFEALGFTQAEAEAQVYRLLWKEFL